MRVYEGGAIGVFLQAVDERGRWERPLLLGEGEREGQLLDASAVDKEDRWSVLELQQPPRGARWIFLLKEGSLAHFLRAK